MTILNILGGCLQKLSMDDFTAEVNLTAEQTAILNELLSCANLVYREVCSVYLPQYHCESVTLDAEHELAYESLTHSLVRPIRLTKDGYGHFFRGGATKLRSDFSGAGELTYSYMPDDLTLASEPSDTRLLAWIFEDGICGEYAFRKGTYDLARAFDEKFRDAMARQRYKWSNPSWRARRWSV